MLCVLDESGTDEEVVGAFRYLVDYKILQFLNVLGSCMSHCLCLFLYMEGEGEA